MKTLNLRFVLLAVVALTAASAQGAVGGLHVTVSDAAGRLTYRGTTDAAGTFSVPPVAPGNYVVQFHSSTEAVRQDQYAIVVAAGTRKVVADHVAGERLLGRGVAMRVRVRHSSPIIGQVATGGSDQLGVKIVNGRTYFLVAPETGTNLGPRWVEEGTRPGRNIVRLSTDAVRDLQERGMGANRTR